MIADSPTAYVESLRYARSQTEGQWRSRAADMTGPLSITFVADAGPGSPLCGLMRVVVKEPQDTGRPAQAMLISVYVAPAHRGSGLADELLQHAVAAAHDELGAGLLQLGVHEENARALAFYVRNGFRDTGGREVYRLDTSKAEILMERELVPSRLPATPLEAGVAG
ncbi:GNAT family N-acetyltransferase [Arthrobacter sp. 92]|uniref:GNAT family N-acetyltransferase n=1 Tax=Arthrobacter sp. 92 TaxID=3418175 RepID=UPI003CFBCB98